MLYDTAYFLAKEIIQNMILKRLRCRLLFLETICCDCAQYASAATQRNIFIDFVTPDLKTTSTRNNHEPEFRASAMHSDYTGVELVWNLL